MEVASGAAGSADAARGAAGARGGSTGGAGFGRATAGDSGGVREGESGALGAGDAGAGAPVFVVRAAGLSTSRESVIGVLPALFESRSPSAPCSLRGLPPSFLSRFFAMIVSGET